VRGCGRLCRACLRAVGVRHARLVFRGHELRDGATIDDYALAAGCTVLCQVSERSAAAAGEGGFDDLARVGGRLAFGC
jgi:hypothetical protein